MEIVVADNNREFMDWCKRYSQHPSNCIFVDPHRRGTWNKLRGLQRCHINVWNIQYHLPQELTQLLELTTENQNRVYEEYFCPFKKSHIQRECFERDCPYLEYERGRSSCSFFKEQIKKRGDVETFTRDIDEGSDTRGITMDLIDEALSQDLIPKRIVIDINKMFWNGHHYRYVYQPRPPMIQSIPEFDALSNTDMIKTEEIPIVIREGIRDAITVEAV